MSDICCPATEISSDVRHSSKFMLKYERLLESFISQFIFCRLTESLVLILVILIKLINCFKTLQCLPVSFYFSFVDLLRDILIVMVRIFG